MMATQLSFSRVGGCRLGRRQVLRRSLLTADRAALDISKMAPLGERLLVKPLKEEEKTAGGILLSSSATESAQTPQLGEILSIGNKVELDLKVGDTIVYSKYGTSDIEVAQGKIVVVGKDSVMGVCV